MSYPILLITLNLFSKRFVTAKIIAPKPSGLASAFEADTEEIPAWVRIPPGLHTFYSYETRRLSIKP